MEIKTNKFNWGIMGGDMYLWVGIPAHQKQATEDFINKLDEKYYTVKITQHREKRSLDSNSYYWTLCGKLSAVIKIPAVEIYRQHIQDIGDNYEILPIKDEAVEKFKEAWGHNGIGWVVNTIGPSKLKGYTNLMAYYGSSTYDTKQMSRLIDLMIEDCKEHGIETMSPVEIEALKTQWGK